MALKYDRVEQCLKGPLVSNADWNPVSWVLLPVEAGRGTALLFFRVDTCADSVKASLLWAQRLLRFVVTHVKLKGPVL